MSDEIVRDLARRAGIAVEWQDYAGRATRCRAACPAPRAGSALGLPADTSRELSSSRRLLTKRSSLADLPPLVTAVAGRPTRLDVGGNEAQPAELVLESGEEPAGRAAASARAAAHPGDRRRSAITGFVWRTGKSCWRYRRLDAARSRMSFRMRDYGVWQPSFMA